MGKLMRFKAIEDAKRSAAKDLDLLRQVIERSQTAEAKPKQQVARKRAKK